MDHAFGIIGLGVAAFASTNLDDLLLLASLFVDAEFSPRSIILGQFAGMAVLVAVSAAAALVAVRVPEGRLALDAISAAFVTMAVAMLTGGTR